MDELIKYNSIEQLVRLSETTGRTISDIVIEQQAEELETTKEALMEKMASRWQIMKDSIEPGCDPDIRSTSGLTGGTAYKMRKVSQSGKSLTGSVISGALYRALAVSELNASMGRIVAAPTAGSCGILPAALLTMQDEYGKSDEQCIKALFTASAIGMVIANQACLAGAHGGCQAECGSAAAMAAGAIVELCDGSAKMISDAIAIAIKNILGLVCDPVAGLVEIPCTKRNASGVAGAFVAAELALAGITSAIPADEVIWSMKKVGDAMSASLKETAEGGLAATPTAKKLFIKVFGNK